MYEQFETFRRWASSGGPVERAELIAQLTDLGIDTAAMPTAPSGEPHVLIAALDEQSGQLVFWVVPEVEVAAYKDAIRALNGGSIDTLDDVTAEEIKPLVVALALLGVGCDDFDSFYDVRVSEEAESGLAEAGQTATREELEPLWDRWKAYRGPLQPRLLDRPFPQVCAFQMESL